MMNRSPHQLYTQYIINFFILLSFLSKNASTTVAQSSTFGSEMAYFQTPQMMQNVSHRQDFCDLYEVIRSGSLELKDSLRGQQLNVLMGAYEDSFFRYNPDEGIDPAYPGISAVLMDELARRAGFTWRNSFGTFVEPKGPDYNESWSDLLVWGIDTYDLCVDWWPRNLERLSRGVAFTQEWYDSSIILIGKSQQPQSQQSQRTRRLRDYWNWMRPFSWEVWLTTVATVFLSGLVFQILEHMNGNRGNRKWFEWWSDNLFLSAVNATQAYEYGTPKGLPSKLFCFSMALWSLILTATYTANLASLLVENQQEEVRIVSTVQEAVVYGFQICTWDSTNSDTYIKEVFPDAKRKPKKTLEEMYEGLQSGECAFAVEVIQQLLINEHVQKFNPNCDLEWIGNGKVVSSSAAGFATISDAGYKCTGLIRDVINIHMEEMIYDGFLRDAWEVENSLAKERDCDTFQPQDFLSANVGSSLGTDDAGSRRRKLEEIKKRQELAKQYSPPGRRRLHDDGSLTGYSHHHRRRMKASSKSAASSAGAIDGGVGEASQMELDAMLGTFFIHWAIMFIAIVMGFTKKHYREKYGKNIGIRFGPKEGHVAEEQATEYKEQVANKEQAMERVEESMRMKDELQWQMEDLMRTFKQSKATLIKEQEELQWKMDQLKGTVMDDPKDGHNHRTSLVDDLRSL